MLTALCRNNTAVTVPTVLGSQSFYKMFVFLGNIQDAGVNHCPRLHQLPHPVAQLFSHITTILFSSESWERDGLKQHRAALFQAPMSSYLCSQHRPNSFAVTYP